VVLYGAAARTSLLREPLASSWLPVCLAGTLVARGAFGGAPGRRGILGPRGAVCVFLRAM
jgi:hypothetical protein